ncbi:vitamin K epoxide reductase family protein [uncultured Parabacteroides sp.]|uniref:vitamin K epoxide reductase family protein n=1 Tax=uncultured Parabacteroides sp. TaxID=512312 RepID=UPI0025E71F36|nr:vitamin K epoxide reductase family protein [uncultured Parabacteroides sp.]
MIHEGLFDIIKRLMRDLEIDIPTSNLLESIEIQRGKQTFGSIRSILSDFGIFCKSYSLDLKELSCLDSPYIVQVSRDSSEKEFVLLRKNEGLLFHLYSYQKGSFCLNRSEFEGIYSGVVLVPFVDEYSGVQVGEHIAESKWKGVGKYIGIGIAGITILLFEFLHIQYDPRNILYWNYLLFLTLIGLWISYCIVKIEHNQEDGFVQRVCAKSNCHRVLHSKAANPVKGISMGDLGVIFFMMSLLFLLFDLNVKSIESVYSCLAICSFMTLPYTLFSICYQRFVVKSWCLFCLSVIGLFWLEAIGGILRFLHKPFCFDTIVIVSAILFLLISVSFCLMLRWGIVKSVQNANSRQFIYLIKRDIELFRTVLGMKEKLLSISLDINFPILANGNEEHEILLVLSPSCPSCVQVYQQALAVSHTYPDLAKIRVCMKCSDDSSHEAEVIQWMYSAYLSGGLEDMAVVHKTWMDLPHKLLILFEEKMASFGMTLDNRAIDMYNRNVDWIRQNEISFAPVIIYNRKILPNWYLFYDLIKILIRIDHEKC